MTSFRSAFRNALFTVCSVQIQ